MATESKGKTPMQIVQNFDAFTIKNLMKKAQSEQKKFEARQQAEDERFANHPSCRKVKRLLDSTASEYVVFAVIVANFVLTIYETDLKVKTPDTPPWLMGCSVAFIIFYVLELSLRFYAVGFSFFTHSINVLDLVIVLIDITCAFLDIFSHSPIPGSAFLRIFRVARVMRLMTHVHELYLMLFSLISTLKAIFWAVILILLFLTCCSVIAVDILHPINVKVAEEGQYDESGCVRCPDAFRTVWEANLTFIQQILAGDSWGAVSLPIINKAPWTLFFFLFVLLIVNLGLMNLVLTVIVDQASEARHANVESMVLDKVQEFKAAKQALLHLCAEMDGDSSGDLTLEELLHGYDSNPHFSNYMAAMDTSREDIATVFRMMDENENGSGCVSYAEFVDQMHKLKTQDSHTTIVLMHFEIQDLKRKLRESIQSDKRRSVTERSASVIIQSVDESKIGEEVADGAGQLTANFAGDKQNHVAVHDAGQVAEARFLSGCLPMQSSTGESQDSHVEKGARPPTGIHRLLASSSSTQATSSPQPGASRLVAARAHVQPELKNVQDSIAKAVDIIIQDSLAISHERVVALTSHPDFLGRLQGSATNQRTDAISSGGCFLPVQPEEDNKINSTNVSTAHNKMSAI